jgi:uncharacterized membrane protein
MGTLHPLIVHLPIGILLLNAILVVLSKREKYAYLSAAIPLILLLGAISSVVACATGWLLSQNGDYMEHPDNFGTEGVLFYHQWLGISVAIASLALYYSKKYDNQWLWAALVGLISVAGHYGGTLTHGENYLFSTEKVKSTEGSVVANKLPDDIQEAFVYTDLIVPILKNKCFNCHNNTKQKGGLNMENKATFLKGGKNGAIVSVNNSSNSELIKRLLLDINDEHHMSPKGKPQPTKQDITLLRWWIDKGLDFDKKVKDLEQNEAVKAVFVSLKKDTNKDLIKTTLPYIPLELVTKAEEKQIELVRKKGILLMPIAPNSNYLQANFISIPKATNQDVKELLPYKAQIIWLKLNGTKINDSALIDVAQLTQLRRLNLDNTHITNAGIAHLSTLTHLQYLNIVGTDITTEGLIPLSNLSNLQQVFLFKTSILPVKFKELQQKMPHTLFDTGGYKVPSWTSDTAIFKKDKTK